MGEERSREKKISREKERNRDRLRIGQGIDFHRFIPESSLVLGGCEIPHEYGLDGHSDADVLTHAVMDAILGALGKGDIGEIFPDSDPEYKGVRSLNLLGHLRAEFLEGSFAIINLDITIIAESPRLNGYKEAMGKNLACTLGINNDRVNIKATTTEGLGFIGENQGMAAQAVVLLEKNFTQSRSDS